MKHNTTGTHSLYTTHFGYPMMFHASVLLPYQAEDHQHLERKRHIGNDVVVLIYKEDDGPVALNSIPSKFNHVFIVITPDRAVPGNLRINVAYKDAKEAAPPFLANPPSYPRNAITRKLLLTKIINAERQALQLPAFVVKTERVKLEFLRSFVEKYPK